MRFVNKKERCKTTRFGFIINFVWLVRFQFCLREKTKRRPPSSFHCLSVASIVRVRWPCSNPTALFRQDEVQASHRSIMNDYCNSGRLLAKVGARDEILVAGGQRATVEENHKWGMSIYGINSMTISSVIQLCFIIFFIHRKVAPLSLMKN